MENFHVSPAEIDEWTLSEITLGLENIEQMDKARNMSDRQIIELIRARSKKSNLEKLIEAKGE
jgi:hypothetical protein